LSSANRVILFNPNSEVEKRPARSNDGKAGFPACRFTGLSSPAFPAGAGDWKVARTGGQECPLYPTAVSHFGVRVKGVNT
jgi:hypothetical protein